jgi:bacterioferritin-associated ferredoxin
VVADEVDQFQVGVVADGVHAHEDLRKFEGVGSNDGVGLQSAALAGIWIPG